LGVDYFALARRVRVFGFIPEVPGVEENVGEREETLKVVVARRKEGGFGKKKRDEREREKERERERDERER
jgi:hypothetical protein